MYWIVTTYKAHIFTQIYAPAARNYGGTHGSLVWPVATYGCYYYFASAAVAVDSSHMTASSSTSWSRFSPPSNFVNGHVSTMWFMVCRWPQSQEGDWARPHYFVQVIQRHGPWPVPTAVKDGHSKWMKKHVLTPLRWKDWERFCGFRGQLRKQMSGFLTKLE